MRPRSLLLLAIVLLSACTGGPSQVSEDRAIAIAREIAQMENAEVRGTHEGVLGNLQRDFGPLVGTAADQERRVWVITLSDEVRGTVLVYLDQQRAR